MNLRTRRTLVFRTLTLSGCLDTPSNATQRVDSTRGGQSALSVPLQGGGHTPPSLEGACPSAGIEEKKIARLYHCGGLRSRPLCGHRTFAALK